jgi:hypothetical protein
MSSTQSVEQWLWVVVIRPLHSHYVPDDITRHVPLDARLKKNSLTIENKWFGRLTTPKSHETSRSKAREILNRATVSGLNTPDLILR